MPRRGQLCGQPPAGTPFYKLTCPKSGSRTFNQKYFTDIIIYAGTSPPANLTVPAEVEAFHALAVLRFLGVTL